MPNDRKTNIPKLRQLNKPDRRRDAAIGLNKAPRSRAFVEILREAIAPLADRRRTRQLSAVPATL